MSLRTPSTTQNRQSLLDLQRTKERLALNNARIASGNQITTPGDDPTGAAAILDLGNSIQSNKQYIKQADSGMSFLTSSESAIAAAINDVQRLMELAQTGSASSAPEVEGIRANLLDLANTQVQGKYIFAGTATTLAPPFVDAGAAAVTPAAPYSTGPINYVGNGTTISLDITAQTSVPTNIPGSTVFFGTGGQLSATDLFKQVTDLRDGLLSGNAAAVKTANDNLTNIMNTNLSQARTNLGAWQTSMSSTQNLLSGFNISLQGLQSSKQSTDYPQAITDYTSDQTVQSATLSALSKSAKTNLFDYLG